MTTQTTRPSAWLGMVIFSGVIVMLLGSFQLIEGIVAIGMDEHYFTTSSGLAVDFNYTVWGVFHSMLGLLTMAAGLGVLAGKMWARVIGIGVAAISALGNLLFLPAQPFWCTLIIALDVLVVYTLAVHGREAR
ncbi:membrane protein [Actinoplanes italicus]|uniref:DUF7144 domain-containing protein n=1 Tax=Actinoplanes italicus TaxID=113567 RepID=A0A2T0K8E3_9ACTN|nr:hypothetical protein [Actinoplanes italicus]PRX19321.1 hypothetical protein CLV67_11073 [Actinoplanes italicus]GIE30663.1 membrane protein [Actinoplanes italicus]